MNSSRCISSISPIISAERSLTTASLHGKSPENQPHMSSHDDPMAGHLELDQSATHPPIAMPSTAIESYRWSDQRCHQRKNVYTYQLEEVFERSLQLVSSARSHNILHARGSECLNRVQRHTLDGHRRVPRESAALRRAF